MFEEEVNELKLNYEDALKKRDEGDYKGAVEALYKALDIDNKNVDVLVQLAEIYSLLNDCERSIKYYSAALEVEPDNQNLISATFSVCFKAGLYREALNYAKRALDIEKSEKNYSQLIKVIDKFGDMKSLRDLLNEPNLSSKILFEIGLVFIRHAFLQDAEALLSRMSEDDYKNAFGGIIAFNKGETDTIECTFENINIENDEVFNIKGLICTDKMNFADAIKYFNSAINLNSDEPKYYFNLANAYFYNGWFKEAECTYRKAINFDLENVDYRFALANMFYEISEFNKAKQEVENIRKIDPEHTNTKVLNALLKYKNKDFLGAKSDLENVLLFVPNSNYINISLAKILIELGEFERAEELVLKVLANDKENLYAMSVFAKLLLCRHTENDALEIVDCILNKNKYYMDAFLIGMQAAFAVNNYELVKKYASDAISIDINFAEAYYYLALLSETENDFTEAIECLKRAILADLNNSEYYVKMAQIYEKLSDFKSALDYVSEAVSIEPDNTEYMLYYSALAKLNRNICQKK